MGSFHMIKFTFYFGLHEAQNHAAEEKRWRETRHAHSCRAAGAARQSRWQTVLTTGSKPDRDAVKSSQARKLRTGWHIPVVLLYDAMGCNLRLYLPWSLGWVQVTICSSSSLKIMGRGWNREVTAGYAHMKSTHFCSELIFLLLWKSFLSLTWCRFCHEFQACLANSSLVLLLIKITWIKKSI